MKHLRRILVATDFSAAGQLAVGRAGQLAAQYHCDLMVFHATPDWTLFSARASAHQAHYAAITRNAEELLHRDLTWLGQEYGLSAVRAEVSRDRATVAIARVVDSFQPDLLIIGAAGEHLATGADSVLGGTALKLLTRVSVALLLVRNFAASPYATTLAAIGSDPSIARGLIQWASTLAGSGKCDVVRAYDAPYANRMRLCGYSDSDIEQSAQEQRQIAQQDCSLIDDVLVPGAHLFVHIVRGATVATVLEQVRQLAPQLLVIGRHAHHANEEPGARAAGPGTRIAYHCQTDVLLVP